MCRSKWKGSSEIQGESVYSWSKGVASRTMEDFKRHGTTSQVKRNEQTRLSRSTVQVRASSKTEIGIYYGRFCSWVCSTACRYPLIPRIWGYRRFNRILHQTSGSSILKVLTKGKKSVCLRVVDKVHADNINPSDISDRSQVLIIKSMAPDGNSAICSCADKPWLLRNPSNLQHAQPITYIMPTQDLERHDERIREEVAIHTGVEDLDRAVIR